MNFCLPIEPSIGSMALRRYALNAQPKSAMSTPVKRRSMPLMNARRKRPPPGVAPRGARAARDVGAVLERLDQARQVLRRVLEVAVHRDQHLAPRPDEPRVHGGVLPEVPLEAHRAHPPVGRVEPLELAEGRVRRAVVDEDQLERVARAVERFDRPRVELAEARGLVVDRDHDRDGRRRLVGIRREPPRQRLLAGARHG